MPLVSPTSSVASHSEGVSAHPPRRRDGTDASGPKTIGIPGPGTWTEEMQILALCARPVFRSSETAHLHRLLHRTVDWSHLVDSARRHGVLGMLYHHLARHAADRVPEDVLQEMQQATQAVQFHNLQVMKELARFARRFADAGVPLLSFKGPLLAQRYYGNLAFRRFGDVDLLVRRADHDAAVQLLQDAGFESLRGLTSDDIRVYQRENLGHEFGRAATGVVAELHLDLLNRALTFRLDADALWSRAQAQTVGSAPICELAPADLLLYLCAHGTKHHWNRLLWTCDVAQVVRRHPDLLSADLLADARRIGSLRTLLLGLRLAERWLGTELPPVVTREISADAVVDRLVREVETRWFGTDEGRTRDPGWATFWFTVRTRQRLRDNGSMIAHYLRLAVTPTEKDRAFTGPSAPNALLYLTRPVRLLWELLKR